MLIVVVVVVTGAIGATATVADVYIGMEMLVVVVIICRRRRDNGS
jgi:hypothetical protein